MSGIFDETNMRQALGACIPDGETLLAGIHAIAKEMSTACVFKKCIRVESGLVPDENGGIVSLYKKKYSACDIYFGITQTFMVIADCEKYDYFYEFDNEPDVNETDIQELSSELCFEDIGKCFPLADIQSCEIKNGWMGSVKCFLTMKNGSCFRLLFPKLGGLGGGMPHHAQYREAILARLSRSST